MTDDRLDGNAAAGLLREVFVAEMTTALSECAGCGRSARLAETAAYVRAPGLVLRCAACDNVLVRLVRNPTRVWVNMQGLRNLQLLPRSTAAEAHCTGVPEPPTL